MKKIAQTVVAAIVSFGFVGLVGSSASAADPVCNSIVITNTGPNSNNQGTCTVNTTVNVTCTNNIYVLNANAQAAVTGAASVLGNTSGGPAITGAATNENGTTVQIGASCGQQSGGGGAPSAPSAPSAPGAGAAAAPAAAQPVAALPFTAASSPLETATIVAIVLGAAALTARIAISAYRRIALK